MVNYFIYAKDFSASTNGMRFYHSHGLKTLYQFKKDVKKIQKEILTAGDTPTESRIAYLHWGEACYEVSENETRKTYHAREGDHDATDPTGFINWIRDYNNYGEGDTVKLLYIITDGLISENLVQKCFELNEKMHYEKVIFHAFSENLRAINLSVAASFLKGQCMIYRNNELYDNVDMSTEYNYDKINLHNFAAEREHLKSYIKLKYISKFKYEEATALQEIEKLKNLRNRLFRELTLMETDKKENTPVNLETKDKTVFLREIVKTNWYKSLNESVNVENNEIEKSISTLITPDVTHSTTLTYSLPQDPKALKFFYANTRSIVKHGKLDELKCILKSFSSYIHVIILCETWIKSDSEAESLALPYYTHYYNYRTDGKGGGVSIYVHNNLEHNFIEELTEDDNHYLWVHLKRFSLDIGAIYKPGRTNSDNFLETYTQQLQKRKRVIVFGDFNYDLLMTNLRPTQKEQCKDYKRTLKENGYTILNKVDPKYTTRDTATTRTILDHICTSLKNNRFHLAIIQSAMADHKHLYLEVNNCKTEKPKRLSYHAIDYTKLQTIAQEQLPTNLNKFEEIQSALSIAVNESKITKTKIQNPPRSDWINRDIIDAIDKRNELWYAHLKTPSDEHSKSEYITKKEEVHKAIQTTKSQYYYMAFKKCNLEVSKEGRGVFEICERTFRPFYTINQHKSFYEELVKNTRKVQISDDDETDKIEITYGAIDSLEMNRVLSRYKLFIDCSTNQHHTNQTLLQRPGYMLLKSVYIKITGIPRL
ncbi:endonuclease-reverse transcriptase domain-containing protein [Phthorimaea operculella]|nr:endonuclease-reverse transcriptase domain-containing protein [Phthorimaea operculella]